jgi:O-antigen/teichoic acid export membrane protein
LNSVNRSTARTVASNSFWHAFESVFSLLLVFATSIPLARVLGPERLGYFNYVMWLANVSTVIAVGNPSAAHKFMAEYLARSEPGVARSIFYRTLRSQIVTALAITVIGEIFVVGFGDPKYRAVSFFQVLSILPSMINAIPSQANNANSNMKANVAGSIVSSLIYLTGVVLSLVMGWNLMGVAITFFVSRSVELMMRITTVMRWVNASPAVVIPREVVVSMRSFMFHSFALFALNLVVWDRSDLVLLKYLNHDLKQITFFSTTFNLIEKAILIPQVFAHALGVSMIAEYGKDPDRAAVLAAAAGKYLYLIAGPLLFGVALLSAPIIRLLYGPQYLPAIPVLAIAGVLAVFKPLFLPTQYLFFAHNRQGPMVIWSMVCGIANVAIDWMLIPSMGARGAALGNGIAQALAVIGLWVIGGVLFGLRLDKRAIARITLAILAMAPPVLLMDMLPPWLAIPAGVASGAAIFLFVLKWMHVLAPEDTGRLERLRASLPGPVQPFFNRTLRWVSSGQYDDGTLSKLVVES